MHRLCLALAGVLSPGACVFSSEYERPVLPTAYLVENPPILVQASPGQLQLRFSYGVNDDGCRQLPESFSASINGTSLTPLSRGDVSDIGIESPDWYCTPPGGTWSLAPETAELVLADETLTHHIDLRTMLARRSLTLIDGNEWTRGLTYDVAWSPSGDLAAQRPDHARISIPNASSVAQTADATLSASDALHVTMPSATELDFAGSAEITFSWAMTQTPCANCRLIANGSLTRAIVIH